MFAEASTKMTTGRKHLMSDRDELSAILFAAILICYVIIQMDLESLILAYMSVGAFALVLCREQTFRKMDLSLDVCHRLWRRGEGQRLSKPNIQQHQTRIYPAIESDENGCINPTLNTMRSPQVHEPHAFKLPRVECLAAMKPDHDHFDVVKAGCLSASADGEFSSSLEAESTWLLELQDEKASCKDTLWNRQAETLPPGLTQMIFNSPPGLTQIVHSHPFQPSDDQCQSWFEFNVCKLKEVDQHHSLIDLIRCQPEKDPALEKPEASKAVGADPIDDQLCCFLEEPAASKVPVALSSLGAKFHPQECIPCKFLVSRSGCKDGQACVYCHAPHPDLNQGQRRRLMSRINRKKRQDAMLDCCDF